MRQVISGSPFHMWGFLWGLRLRVSWGSRGNQGTEEVNKLPKVTQKLSGRTKVRTQAVAAEFTLLTTTSSTVPRKSSFSEQQLRDKGIPNSWHGFQHANLQGLESRNLPKPATYWPQNTRGREAAVLESQHHSKHWSFVSSVPWDFFFPKETKPWKEENWGKWKLFVCVTQLS